MIDLLQQDLSAEDAALLTRLAAAVDLKGDTLAWGRFPHCSECDHHVWSLGVFVEDAPSLYTFAPPHTCDDPGVDHRHPGFATSDVHEALQLAVRLEAIP